MLCRKVAELRKSEREALLVALTQYRLTITGHEGYAKAEVRCMRGLRNAAVLLLPAVPEASPKAHPCALA